MISRIKVSNFKSLLDFEIKDMGHFVCLIGLNGSGKTTILQFFDFIRHVLLGDISDWLNDNKWQIYDLLHFENKRKSVVEFEIDVLLPSGLKQTWEARFNTQELRCTYERLYEITSDGQKELILSYEDKQLKVKKDPQAKLPLDFSYTGSILRFLKEEDLYKELSGLKIFGILNSKAISQSYQSRGDIKDFEVDSDGHGLVGFISNLSKENQEQLYHKIHDFYSPLKRFDIKKQRFGWKTLLLSELERVYFDSSHLSDGTLRLFVILSQLYSHNNVILFDEIENGFNQELIEKLLKTLLNFNGKQVFVTTHSALFLNYMDDDTAKSSVYIIFKNGVNTMAQRFFDSDLETEMPFIGPGEIMSSLNLADYSKRLAENSNKKCK